jgi:hypothetical protein
LFAILLSAVSLTADPASGASVIAPAPGEVCMVSAGVREPMRAHISEVADGTIQFGTNLTIMTDCPGGFNLTITEGSIKTPRTYYPGGFYFGEVSTATTGILLEGENWTVNYSGLTFYPPYLLGQVMDSVNPEPYGGESVPVANLRAHEAFIAVVSVLIAWLASVFVLDWFAEWRTSKKLIEEVAD